ncbi:hypothetical protein V8F20_004154 [Naviculisporaceae sp. PSN 640]
MDSSFQAAWTFAIADLAKLKNEVSKDDNLVMLQLDIEDAIGRFSVWAMNIGAIQHASLRKSLDYRLRDAPEIRHQLLSAFERLSEAADIASRIVTTKLRDEPKDDPILPGRWPDSETANPANELNDLFLSIKSSIDTLFRLSMLLSRHRPKGRLPHSGRDDDKGPPPSDPIDVTHICDLFPSIREKPWLVKRIAEAMSRRRRYIKYREKHRRSLATVEDMGRIGDENEPESTGTIATTFVDGEKAEFHTKAEVKTTLTSATSFISNVNDEDEEGPGTAIPDLRHMRMYGRELRYGEPFECPLCRTIQSVADRKEWKAYVFADLEPYVCTFEDCQSSSSLFASRHVWWQHEIDNHRRGWQCTICASAITGTEASSTQFTSKRDIESHIRKRHSDTVIDIQVEFVVKMCENPINIGSPRCPFCIDWVPTDDETEGPVSGLKGLGKHVARHMQRIALASIPIHLEGLQVVDVLSDMDPGEGSSRGSMSTKNLSSVLLPGDNPFGGKDSNIGSVADDMVRSSFLDAAIAGVTALGLRRSVRDDEEGRRVPRGGIESNAEINPDTVEAVQRFTWGGNGGRPSPGVEDLLALAKYSWDQANQPGRKREDRQLR